MQPAPITTCLHEAAFVTIMILDIDQARSQISRATHKSATSKIRL
jgi:hypothetical protein